jgi:hypothetical protein
MDEKEIPLSLRCKKEKCTFRITADYKLCQNILAYIKQPCGFNTPLKSVMEHVNTFQH